MEKNILLKIAYDGSNFSGWQRQPEKRTVQGVLEEALSKFCACDIKINGTSRTDAGVHALEQCASFKADFGIPIDRLKLAVNNYLSGGMSALNQAGDVRIISAEEVQNDFHARFDCKGKTYRYVIKNGGEPDIFRRNYCYYVKDELDIEAMKKAAEHIVGTHDFASFQSAGGNERETTVRTVSELTIYKTTGLNIAGRNLTGQNITETNIAGHIVTEQNITDGNIKDQNMTDYNTELSNAGSDIVIEITGDGFLYNMVRIIVGTLVETGLGKKNPDYIIDIIKSCDRTKAGHTAPAAGLYLKEIYF